MNRIVWVTTILLCALVAVVLGVPQGQRAVDKASALPLVSLPVLTGRLKSAPRPNPLREVTLRKMFETAGCPDARLSEQPVDPGQPPNLICKLPGRETSLIVVGGHLDKVRRGNGIVDDWSGSSMLPSLYQSLSAAPRKHTFLFIGFTEEEKGLVGSKYYVRHAPPSLLRSIRAMVNLECLGLNPPEVWEDHAAPVLLRSLETVAGTMRINVPGVDLERVGRDDAMSFRKRKVLTITIHSLSQGTIRVLHSNRDNISAEHMDDYYESYRLAAEYLAYLDKTLP
ncbi:MAG TPA: M28 family peptidase [Terriglobia bacterium]|nr:M28 family peptidase [Terriglobia bacterium]